MPEPIEGVKPAEVPAEVPTPAPKEEVTPAGVNGGQPAADPKKADEIVTNLQTALKEERSFRQQDRQKVGELEAQLKEALEFQKRMSSAMNPEPEKPAEQPAYMTKDEAEQFWKEKEEESRRQSFEQSQQEKIKIEIKDLQKEYDGQEGRLKYDDTEVLEWQKQNGKLFLTPKEAFSIMKQKEILDFQVKQALSGKKKVEDVERPSAAPGTHDPKDVKPSTDQEVKQAVAEAIKNASAEM